MSFLPKRSTIALLIVFLCSCGQNKIFYARATRLPEEAQGFMRLAQNSVKVNIVGKDDVGEFRVEQPGAYLLVHEQDVKALVENTKKLQELTKGKTP